MDDNLEKLKHFIHGSTPIPGPVINGFVSVVGESRNCDRATEIIFDVLIEYIENLETRIKALEDKLEIKM